MSSGVPRRDNGLSAETYDRLADVETHLVDGLLERLRDAEVAAYTAPSTGRRGPYGDTVPPLGPSDSVWVDSGRREHARGVVDRYLADVADEAAWAGLVEDFHRESPEEVPRWPASENVDPDDADLTAGREEPPATRSRAVPPLPPRPVTPSPRSDEDHFQPPPPPPLPTTDPVTRFAWAGALGGPAVLLLAAMAGLPLGGWVGGLAVIAFMAGFVTLVARMKDRPPTDSGPDDGAVV